MTRSATTAVVVALLAALALAGLAWSGQVVLPSCLAGWLLVSAFPLGALPLVMGAEALGLPDGPMLRRLRRLLGLMPLASILSLPVLVARQGLEAGRSPDGAAWIRTWMATDVVIGRTVVFLIVWIGLAWLFSRPRGDQRPRGGLARLGVGLHLVMGTLLATDWIEVVQPGLNSSALGLLFMAAQTGLAVSGAVMWVAWTGRGELAPAAGGLLATLSGVWLFLHFTQYLVVWSANLPEEVPWYQQRDVGLGGAGEAVALLACIVAVTAALMGAGARVWGVVAAVLLAVHSAEMFWLVVPASRGSFTLDAPDLAAILVALGFATAFMLLDRPGDPGVGMSHVG